MAVYTDRESRVFTLQTKNTTYQMKADDKDVFLHTYYGEKTDNSDKSYLIRCADRGFSGNPYEVGTFDRSYSLDMLPQEYSCFGTGDYRISALRVRQADGSRAAELRYAGCETRKGKYAIPGLPAAYGAQEEADTLEVILKDEACGIEVRLLYGVFEKKDVITRAVRITNRSERPVVLEKAASLCLDWQQGEFDWLTFYGRHAMERNVQRTGIAHGVQSVGSVRGASSHHYNPFAVLCEKGTDETKGLCYGFSFMYSGEFLIEAEKDQADQTRFVCGIHPDDFDWTLNPGESFDTPEVLMSCSAEGFGGMSRNLHDLIRENVCRGEWKHKRRPILINNWEGTYFDFTGDKLVSIAEEAAKLGVELFVMDDGWFGKRDSDNSGLGDWYPNEEKLGCTLKELGERIEALGMKFGIWFEPECISEDSDLYRAHPDWAVQIPGRKPNLSRNQLILDFSREDVQEYIIERLSAVLDSAPISYVKWDFNRSICDKFSANLSAGRQGEMAHRFVLGLYRVLEELLERYPHLLLEGCSGGGGRFDTGMLYYSPQIWCSDDTDAIERLQIQYGTSFAYPVNTMGAHVSAVPNHQTGRVTPIATRACVAMAGTFGYELDVNKMTDEEKEAVKRQIQIFKEQYDLISYGDYYRLTDVQKSSCAVWETAAKDGSEALVSAVWQHVQATPAFLNVKVRGLCEDGMYRVMRTALKEKDAGAQEKEEQVISGSSLMHGGLPIPAADGEYAAWQIYLERIS
ncbi:MAG: alpha-galactosidase [Firmicutes bacterium]|nr:alpha-galactosidase [Bacillota bacterium]